jgi:hypothetical protein
VASDKAVRLGAILAWLEKGRITLPDACERIRSLGLGDGEPKSTHQVLAADANGDLPVPDGSTFSEISDAYTSGKLSRSQYEALAEAAGVPQLWLTRTPQPSTGTR